MSKKQACKNVINITSTALNRLSDIMKKTNSHAIKLSLKSGGCNGFEYKLEPTTELLHKKDELFTEKNVNVHVCGKSLLYLLGTEIDWKEDIMGRGFEFENPLAQASCGCGVSFSPKF